jgi:hypothetical protein
MPRIAPTQVVATIDRLFPGTSRHKKPQPTHSSGNANALRGIINLVNKVPDELIILPEDIYTDLILATSAIQNQLDIWTYRGDVGLLQAVKGLDPLVLIREALDQCTDQYPPPATTAGLSFIADAALRDNIRSDIAAADRALQNFEWKAATVLAGAVIEALLHWRLDQQPPISAEIAQSVSALMVRNIFMEKPPIDRDHWGLHHFIEVSGDLKLIEPHTVVAANLAKNFRNLIHPGRSARTGQTCDRATALSALAGIEHVVRDLARFSAMP